ncbi:MAG: tRNA (guanosine(37)-N1)-methyltransferase TrmD [Candidatus Pacebacteria bacterium]|jgi:tRNA (guanine37-N1)-methyltransferase|nr:tRNA (guanosine(37)-N1)-methyltransferase TrmD [Candidatus Paceibacterota bacterium]
MLTFHIITLFPESLTSYIGESILSRAQEKKLIKIKVYNPRDFAEVVGTPEYPRLKVDGRPYSGGPGMVLLPGPILRAVGKARGKTKTGKWKTIIFSPGGTVFTNAYAKNIIDKKITDIIMICGRYEGIDARVKKILKAEEVSIGEYVLTGGELPAMVAMDSISRQIKGVLGKFESLEENRISSHEVYTRPEIFEYQKKKYKVPAVLLSGDHKKIEEWKRRG